MHCTGENDLCNITATDFLGIVLKKGNIYLLGSHSEVPDCTSVVLTLLTITTNDVRVFVSASSYCLQSDLLSLVIKSLFNISLDNISIFHNHRSTETYQTKHRVDIGKKWNPKDNFFLIIRKISGLFLFQVFRQWIEWIILVFFQGVIFVYNPSLGIQFLSR